MQPDAKGWMSPRSRVGTKAIRSLHPLSLRVTGTLPYRQTATLTTCWWLTTAVLSCSPHPAPESPTGYHPSTVSFTKTHGYCLRSAPPSLDVFTYAFHLCNTPACLYYTTSLPFEPDPPPLLMILLLRVLPSLSSESGITYIVNNQSFSCLDIS